jgi:predicted RNase H-like nuclease (RuvC/YqgF family)
MANNESDISKMMQNELEISKWIQEIKESLGAYKVYIDISIENQKELFNRLNTIQTIVDTRLALALERDKQILTLIKTVNEHKERVDGMSDEIKEINQIVKNGLSTRIQNIEKTVNELSTSVDTLTQNNKYGLIGFISKSWDDFKNKFGWVIILMFFWFLLWGILKIGIFKEGSFNINLMTTPTQQEEIQHKTNGHYLSD